MTKSQKSALLERCEFDESREQQAAQTFYSKMNCCPQDDRHSFVEGNKNENARLLPIIATLLEINERLSVACEKYATYDEAECRNFSPAADALAFSQSELAKLLKGQV